ncbi:MAG: aspartate carbamoyltransferase, partial [Granulicatella sp.]
VQHERHAEKMGLTKEEYHEQYGLTPQRYEKLKETAIVMHPAPVNRDVEIASELVEAPKSVIFEQMKNGMFMRQAMIEKIIKDNQL